MDWSYNKYEIEYEFLGGYQYFDNCGKILSYAEMDLGYTVSQIENRKSMAERTSEGIIVNFSSNNFCINQDYPSDSGKTILDNFFQWQPIVMNNLVPNSCEKLIIKNTLVSPCNSEEEVFKRLLRIKNPLFEKLSAKFGMPRLMNDICFRFKSGSIGMDFGIHGMSLVAPVKNKVAARFFGTRKQNEILKYRNAHRDIKQDFNWAVALNVTVYDAEPLYPTPENDWNMENVRKLFSQALTSAITAQVELFK